VRLYHILTPMKPFVPDKTLAIRMSSIGDIVLTTPFIRSFKNRFPGSRLDFVVRKEYAELLRHDPNIDTLYEFDAGTGVGGLRTLAGRLRAERYDLVADLHNSLRSRYIRRRLRARKIVKINKRTLARYFLVRFGKNLYRDSVHVADRYIETVARFDVENDGGGLELHIPEGTSAGIGGQMEELKRMRPLLVGMCPSAKHFTKRWPREYYVQLSRKLADTYGAYTVLLGGPEDRAYCEDIRRLIGENDAVNLAGELTLLQTAAVFDHCGIVVTNDTGLMHIAAARKRPLAAVFGPTVRELGFFPYGTRSEVVEHPDMPCRPCSHIGTNECPKRHFRCMKDVRPDRVFDAVGRLLASSPE
jgi:lipopolysaccharide heptosyltransferase II